jgi:prepilin-type N-terminal cleavage/methylation domain-containing protein
VRRPSGFTLTELLVSLALSGLVGGVAIRVLLRQHWAGVSQSERGALQGSLRAGMFYLMSELRELGGTAGDPDILAFAPESLTYRAMRGNGLACAIGPNYVSLDASHFSGYRSPQAGRDSLLLHQEGRSDTVGDDHWLHLPVTSVSGGSCSGTPALQLSTSIDTVLTPLATFGPLEPARTFEIMQIKLYQSAGDYWLGARSVSAGETIQPLIGPLTASGLAMVFFDSSGSVATTAETIRSIDVTLRGLSANPIRTGAGFGSAQRRVDSLTTRVGLRNW